MRNPLMQFQQQTNNTMPTKNDFINAMKKQGPEFLQNMQQLARQRGISEEDIESGMKMLRELKLA